MHKTKENSPKPSKSRDQDTRETDETANEEAYETIDGETSTEVSGVAKMPMDLTPVRLKRLKARQTGR